MNMQTPDWIKPGAMCRTRGGLKARIYAVDGWGFPVHGAILGEMCGGSGWEIQKWHSNGAATIANDTIIDLVGPWIERPIVDWSKMPAWANWVAMDENGEWFWYSEEPRLNQCLTEWIPSGSDCGQIPPEYTPTFTGNWHDSLVERPK